MLLTGTWIKATDSAGLRLTVQAQVDVVVSGVALDLPLLRAVATRHRALDDRAPRQRSPHTQQGESMKKRDLLDCRKS